MAPPMSEAQLQKLRDQQVSPNARVYVQAKQLGDIPTAVTALHYLLAEDPQNHMVKDSLADLYVRLQNYGAAKQLCEEVRWDHPDDLFALNTLASIYLSEENYKEALGCYEGLGKNTQMPFFTYQVAVVRFQLERYGECKAAIEKLIKLPTDQEIFIRIFSGKTQQTVPIQAAAYNLRGNLELKLGQKEQAKSDFEKALELYPEFELAKGNLKQM